MFDLSANQKTQPFVYTKITIVNVLIQKIYKKGYFFFHIYGNYHILGTKIVLYKDIHSTAFTSVREFSDLSSLKINKCSNFTSFFFLNKSLFVQRKSTLRPSHKGCCYNTDVPISLKSTSLIQDHVKPFTWISAVQSVTFPEQGRTVIVR